MGLIDITEFIYTKQITVCPRMLADEISMGSVPRIDVFASFEKNIAIVVDI